MKKFKGGILIFEFIILLLFLLIIEFPKIKVWWQKKERIRKFREELPVFTISLRWLLEYYPVQDAITLLDFGEISKSLKKVRSRYDSGTSFEKALREEFPKEFEDLTERLILIYKTGKGANLLSLYSDKLLSQNLVEIRKRSSRLQIFSIAYTAFAAILPAMASGFAISVPVSGVEYIAIMLSIFLVVLWKVLD